MTKTINKVIIYYEDGTYEEVKAGSNDSSHKQNTPDVNPGLVKRPDWNPFTPQVLPNTPQWTPQYTRDTWPHPMPIYCATSTGNYSPDNKYSITSTGNGNVDISK